MDLDKVLDDIKESAPIVYWVGIIAIVLVYQFFFKKKETKEVKDEKGK